MLSVNLCVELREIETVNFWPDSNDLGYLLRANIRVVLIAIGGLQDGIQLERRAICLRFKSMHQESPVASAP